VLFPLPGAPIRTIRVIATRYLKFKFAM